MPVGTGSSRQETKDRHAAHGGNHACMSHAQPWVPSPELQGLGEGGSKEEDKRNGRHLGRTGKSECVLCTVWLYRQKTPRGSRNPMRSDKGPKVAGYGIDSKNEVDSHTRLMSIGNEIRKTITPLIGLHNNSTPMCSQA